MRMIFAGGAGNPYNFNGIGYNGEPAITETSAFSYSFVTKQWQTYGHLPKGTMDHRRLPYSNG